MNGGSTQQRPGKVVRYWKTRILVSKGPDLGLSMDTFGGTLRIGTDSYNDLVLTDPTVSRNHCEIDAENNEIRVRDAGSTNGVLAGGMRLYDAAVAPNTVLQLGDTQVTILTLSEPIDREQAEEVRFGDLLGASSRMREMFTDLKRIAATDIGVLIEGETGTGKELVAESIHSASARAECPFVVFDCSAVTASLAESELFGHERGAFTGAVASRPGVFEQAHTGTIFIDELGELPKDLQPKLLRVLEKREVRRLGGNRTIPVDVRVVAATNRNLAAEVRLKNFREDLYFRIAAAHVYVPPLRDRLSDLPLLVEHFLRLERSSRSASEIPTSVWELFRSYRWPGNVRELRNAVQRLLITPERPLPNVDTISTEPTHGPADQLEPHLPLRFARRKAADEFEHDYVYSVLQRTDGNVTRAAAIAEVSRQMIQKLMKKYGIQGAVSREGR
jgi:transcriptional regulator with GAF, ATPase, and Fis domain